VAAGAGGVILFGDLAPANLGLQLALVESRAPAGVTPVVMADEEGGEVQRMANLVGSLPWPRTMAATMTPSKVRALATTTARAMEHSGVTMDLAPVLDLAGGPGPDSRHTDGPRSFSRRAGVATSYGLAFARGLEAGGVIPVVKHFPGEGSATANTDAAPAQTPPLSVLRRADLRPFEAAARAHLPVVMVGNATVPGLTDRPASLSGAVIGGILRHQLGFKGVVMTDSLSAPALSTRHLTEARAAPMAVEAGADLLLYDSPDPPATFVGMVAALIDAVHHRQLSAGRLDQAVEAVLTLKHARLCR
jgi:beta-N-acetylhexosaminidase